MPHLTKAEWALAAAFLAMMALFFADATATRSSQRQLEEDADSLATNAGPSIRELNDARSQLSRIRLILAAQEPMLRQGKSPAPEELTRPRKVLEQHLQAYEQLPFYPGEWARWQDGKRQVGVLEGRLGAYQEALRSGAAPTALALEKELGIELERAREAIASLIDLNVDHAQTLGGRMDEVLRRSRQVALASNVVSVVLAAFVAALILRTQRRARETLESQKMAAEERAGELAEFSGRMAHDVLSPMSSQTFVWEMIARLHPNDPRTAELVERGRSALTRTRELVDGLLGFALAGARPPPGVRAETREVLEELLEDLGSEAREAKVELTLVPDSDVPVGCHPGVLLSILSNLVRNAIKYMGDRPRRQVRVQVTAAGERVRFDVTDTGPGISPEMTETIFEPYVRGPGSQGRGIGLGLATVRRLAEAHGGRAGLRSRPGEGSTFWFELPVAGAPAQPQAGLGP